MKIKRGLFILTACMPYLVSASTAIDTPGFKEHHILCQCPLIYKPVCGSDGITYSNDCSLRCVSKDNEINGRPSIHPLYKGVCKPLSCNCPQVLQPICGTNNQTYPNDCYRICDNIRRAQANLPQIGLAYKGPCFQPHCICPEVIIPVCGTNGKTYRNVCILQCYSRSNHALGLPSIYVKSIGACESEICNCPLLKQPVCASDEKTYINQCFLNCENIKRIELGLNLLTVKYNGECINCVCPANYDPVCASDGNTYSNYCQFLCQNKKRKVVNLPELTLRWKGACNCGCTRELKPVCASDRKTWGNRCLLNCENKKRVMSGLPPLTVLYKGQCMPCYCGYCPKNNKPVCGSNVQTYLNICFLECDSNCRVASGRSPISKISDRECF